MYIAVKHKSKQAFKNEVFYDILIFLKHTSSAYWPHANNTTIMLNVEIKGDGF